MLRIIALGQRIERVVLCKRCLDPLAEYVTPPERNTLWIGFKAVGAGLARTCQPVSDSV